MSTTTSTITTSLPAIKRSITTLPKTIQNEEDIWFGSTPAPMYRGYVTNSYKYRVRTKKPSLKFHASDPSPPTLKFIEPHRLVGTKPSKNHLGTTVKPTLQPLYYSSTKNLKKPYEIIKAELKEPSYMTDLNWPKKAKNSPYENSQSLVKPQEVKSLKPKIPELQPLETTTEVYDYSYLYENYPDYQDYDYQQNNYLANLIQDKIHFEIRLSTPVYNCKSKYKVGSSLVFILVISYIFSLKKILKNRDLTSCKYTK